MRKLVKIILSLIFLALLHVAMVSYLNQRYGSVTMIPHNELTAFIFWLLLIVFGLNILVLLQLQVAEERLSKGIRELKAAIKRKAQRKPQKKKLKKPQMKKPTKAQKEAGKKHRRATLNLNSERKFSTSSPSAADESQPPEQPIEDEVPESWREEEFE